MKSLKGVWDRYCCLYNKFFILLIVVCYELFVYKVSFDHYKLLIRYSRFDDLLIDIQSFDDRPYFGEPLLVPFYTFLNADVSDIREDIHNPQYFQSEMKTKNFKLPL